MKEKRTNRLATGLLAALILIAWLMASGPAVEAAPLPLDNYWYSFRGGEDNNAAIANNTARGPSLLPYWSRMVGELNDWGTNSKSSLLVLGESLYFASEDQLYRMSKEGEVTGQMTLERPVGYTARPAYTGGVIIVPLDGGALEAVDPDQMQSVWYQEGPGDWPGEGGALPLQNSSSLYIGNGLCFSLTLALDENWQPVGGYVQAVDIESGKTAWLYEDAPTEGGPAGFNMAGSVILDHWVLTGGEKGELMAFSWRTGEKVSSLSVGSGINSDLVRRGDRVYFTTYDGRLIGCRFDSNGQTLSKVADTAFALKSTSTPVIYDGKLYVGGLAAFGDWEKGTPATGLLAVLDMTSFDVIERHEIEGEVQSSPLLMVTRDESVYVYFTANTETGPLYVLDQEGQLDSWTPPEGERQYTLFSPVPDQNGTVYYAADSGYLFALAGQIPPPSVTSASEDDSPLPAIVGGVFTVAVVVLVIVDKSWRAKKRPQGEDENEG